MPIFLGLQKQKQDQKLRVILFYLEKVSLGCWDSDSKQTFMIYIPNNITCQALSSRFHTRFTKVSPSSFVVIAFYLHLMCIILNPESLTSLDNHPVSLVSTQRCSLTLNNPVRDYWHSHQHLLNAFWEQGTVRKCTQERKSLSLFLELSNLSVCWGDRCLHGVL